MADIPAKRNLPGVYLQTIDKSTVISPSAALYVAALLPSTIGFADYIHSIGNEEELFQTFGAPDANNYEEWFNAARVMLYKVGGIGATLKVIRPIGTGSLNGALSVSKNEVIALSTAQLIKNRDEVDTVTVVFDTDTNLTPAAVKFFSAYPTDVVYKIALTTATDYPTALITTGVPFKGNLDVAPEGTEVGIAILDSSNNILEKWVVDMTAGNVDGYGQDNFIETLNTKSQYVFAFKNDAVVDAPKSFQATALVGGTYVAPTTEAMVNALAKFENTELVDINYVVAHPDLHAETITLCENRQDCSFRAGIAVGSVVGVDQATALSNCETYSETTLPTNTSYGSFAGNALQIFDSYNNRSRWINAAGDMVGLRIRQNLSAQPWYSDAGLNYGQLMEVKRLAQYWDSNDQKALVEAKFNPLILKPGIGNLKFGQRNYTSKPSALRDEGVRELINYIWRAGKTYLEYSLFEFNDEFTRSAIESQMNQFLQNVQDGRGIRRTDDGENGYRVKCDSENNPSSVINQNMLILDISFLPNRAIEEIYFRMTIAADAVTLELV